MDFNPEIKDYFLCCVRRGLWNDNIVPSDYSDIDWLQLQDLACKQGLAAFVIDGLEKLADSQKPPKPILLQWIGEVIQGYEYRYELYKKTIAEMAVFYNQNGFKMMVFKGYACAINWPIPEHRPCGDIDIWQFGRQKEADAVLMKEKGITIDDSHHHHSVFDWGDFMVENHFDFVNVYSHKSSRELEIIFKDLGKDDTHTIDVCGETVYLPSPNLHALFLVRHALNHFASSGINLRQVLDWAFFVEKHSKDVDWGWLCETLDKYHMKDFFNCLNAICVEDLGFPVSIFPLVQFDPNLKERVLMDILTSGYEPEMPQYFIKRIAVKVRRWRSNYWKRELCFGGTDFKEIIASLWSHILKPSTI